MPAEEEEVMSRTSYTIIAIYLLIMCIIAVTGNSTVISMLVSNKKLRTSPNNILLLNLAIADFTVSIFGYPQNIASALAGRWLFGDIGCILDGFVVTFCSLTAINTLLAIGILRYIYVCKPQYKYIITRSRNVVLLVASTWILGFIWAVAPVLGWCAYELENFGTSCSIRWEGGSTADVVYNFALIIFQYCIVVTAMAILYTNIVKTSTATLRRLEASVNRSKEDDEKTETMKEERKITLMIVTMVVTFIVIWSPYAYLSFWSCLEISKLPMSVKSLPTLFAKSSCAMNPLIYGLLNKGFRNEVIRKFTSCLNRSRVDDGRDMTVDGVYIGPQTKIQRSVF